MQTEAQLLKRVKLRIARRGLANVTMTIKQRIIDNDADNDVYTLTDAYEENRAKTLASRQLTGAQIRQAYRDASRMADRSLPGS